MVLLRRRGTRARTRFGGLIKPRCSAPSERELWARRHAAAWRVCTPGLRVRTTRAVPPLVLVVAWWWTDLSVQRRRVMACGYGTRACRSFAMATPGALVLVAWRNKNGSRRQSVTCPCQAREAGRVGTRSLTVGSSEVYNVSAISICGWAFPPAASQDFWHLLEADAPSVP